MKSDLTPCKKILYFDTMHYVFSLLNFILLFVSITSLIVTKDYWYLIAIISIVIVQHSIHCKKGFFLSEKEAFIIK